MNYTILIILSMIILPLLVMYGSRYYHYRRTKKWFINHSIKFISVDENLSKQHIRRYIVTNFEYLKARYKESGGTQFFIKNLDNITDIVHKKTNQQKRS